MTNIKLYNAVLAYLDDRETDDIINIHNEYCYHTNDMENIIYNMYDFDNIISGKTPSEIVQMTSGEKFDIDDDYFWFTSCGVESADFADYMPICREDIARYIEDAKCSLYNDEIQEILDKYDEAE